MTAHTRAVLQAVFVTVLWASSWVLIKIGLEELPALTFAGLRYALAALCLVPWALRRAPRPAGGRFTRRFWWQIALLGVLYYAVTQGTQYAALVTLPAITASLVLSFTAIVVTFLGLLTLGERPNRGQWGGLVVYLAGVLVYFYPVLVPPAQRVGLVIIIVSMLANSAASVLGRAVNRTQTVSPLLITTISMGIGSVLLLGVGIATQGLPALTLRHWLLIVWLAVVNTALAFTLWNHTLRTLTAMQSSAINNLLMIEIPILAWLFLGERLSQQQIVGMVLAAVGIFAVQLQRRARSAPPPAAASDSG